MAGARAGLQRIATAVRERRAAATIVEGADSRPAAQFFDAEMIDDLDAAYGARSRGIDPDYGSGRGRRGTRETREHIDVVRDQFLDELRSNDFVRQRRRRKFLDLGCQPPNIRPNERN